MNCRVKATVQTASNAPSKKGCFHGAHTVGVSCSMHNIVESLPMQQKTDGNSLRESFTDKSSDELWSVFDHKKVISCAKNYDFFCS